MSDAFQKWAELAEGDDDRHLIAVSDVARELNATPHVIVRIALLLKRESNGQFGRPRWWLGGVPWFAVPDIEKISERLAMERAELIVANAEREKRERDVAKSN
jgi:hypothetical protein